MCNIGDDGGPEKAPDPFCASCCSQPLSTAAIDSILFPFRKRFRGTVATNKVFLLSVYHQMTHSYSVRRWALNVLDSAISSLVA